jgi:hypothetical protein
MNANKCNAMYPLFFIYKFCHDPLITHYEGNIVSYSPCPSLKHLSEKCINTLRFIILYLIERVRYS